MAADKCASWWKLMFARDKFTGYSLPLCSMPPERWERSAGWAETCALDCEGLKMPERRPPDQLLPLKVRDVTPLVTLDRKCARFTDLLKPLARDHLWFAVGTSQCRYPAQLLCELSETHRYAYLYPGYKLDGKAVPSSVSRGNRWVSVLLYYRAELLCRFEVPPLPMSDWHEELERVLAGYSHPFHPSLLAAVDHVSALFDIPDPAVEFFADESRVEAKSIVWMQLHIPRDAVERCALTEAVRYFWDGDSDRADSARVLASSGGRVWFEKRDFLQMIVCAYGCHGAVFVERSSLPGLLRVTVPVLLGEEHYSAQPTLRAWALSLPLHALTSLPSVSMTAHGHRAVTVDFGSCARCKSQRNCANRCVATGYSPEPRALLSALRRKRKAIAMS